MASTKPHGWLTWVPPVLAIAGAIVAVLNSSANDRFALSSDHAALVTRTAVLEVEVASLKKVQLAHAQDSRAAAARLEEVKDSLSSLNLQLYGLISAYKARMGRAETGATLP